MLLGWSRAGVAGEQPRRRAVFCCKVKVSGWDFPQNSGTMEATAGDLLLLLPLNLS